MAKETFEIDVRDVEYLRHGERPLLARIFQPRGQGPFPGIVELHGGAWCNGDRNNDGYVNEPLARSGVVVVALDFRMPPEAAYPASLADINYGIRWLKLHAAEFRVRPDCVGAMGISSGGHQAILVGMRPRDPRYTAIPNPAGAPPVDASLNCAVLCWPVIDPLGRYNYAKKRVAEANDAALAAVLPSHDAFWKSEAAMAEGSPTIALERGEKTELPAVLYIQGTDDAVHPRADLERFVSSYRKVGGHVDLQLAEHEGQAFIRQNPSSPATARAIQSIIEFVHNQARSRQGIAA